MHHSHKFYNETYKYFTVLELFIYFYEKVYRRSGEHKRNHFSEDEENRFPRVQYIEFYLFNINNYLNDFYSLDIINK